MFNLLKFYSASVGNLNCVCINEANSISLTHKQIYIKIESFSFFKIHSLRKTKQNRISNTLIYNKNILPKIEENFMITDSMTQRSH